MNRSISPPSDPPPIQFNLPPLSLSLFDAEPSTLQQPNGVVHGSAPPHHSEPSTPTSSHYAAERGSSSTATSVSHEIEELNIHDPPPAPNNSNAASFPGKRHLDEVLYVLIIRKIAFENCAL